MATTNKKPAAKQPPAKRVVKVSDELAQPLPVAQLVPTTPEAEPHIQDEPSALLSRLENPAVPHVGEPEPQPVAIPTQQLQSNEDQDISLGLPSIMDVENPESASPTWIIQLFRKECLKCTRLSASGDGDFGKSKGCSPDKNPNCPGATARIEFTALRHHYMSHWKKFKESGDVLRLGSLMAKLAGEDKHTQQWVYTQMNLLG